MYIIYIYKVHECTMPDAFCLVHSTRVQPGAATLKPTFSRLQLLLATLIGNASVCDPVLIRNMTPVHTIIGFDLYTKSDLHLIYSFL